VNIWEEKRMDKKEKTTFVRKEDVEKRWYLIDAAGKTLGRISSEIAKILRGKHRVDFTPYVDCGDGVIVINASKVVVTGQKRARKVYYCHTGAPGGLRQTPYQTMHARHPEFPIEHAVFGMLPKSRLGHQQRRRLRVFAGSDHGMDAQTPIIVNS
jgi:large subunit ribosomal protein L13